MSEKANLHIERLTERNRLEHLLIASGAVFNFIYSQILPISDVEIAMELDISIPLVRSAIATLQQDELIVQTYQGDWMAICQENCIHEVEAGKGSSPGVSPGVYEPRSALNGRSTFGRVLSN